MGNPFSKEVKVMIAKMFKGLGRRLDEQSDKLDVFKKELKNIKQNEIHNTKTVVNIRTLKKKDSVLIQ